MNCTQCVCYVLPGVLLRIGLQQATTVCTHSCYVGPVVRFRDTIPQLHAVTGMGMLCAGHETAMKPAQLLQLAESIAAKQTAQAEASGKTPSQDCVLLHCALLQVSTARLWPMLGSPAWLLGLTTCSTPPCRWLLWLSTQELFSQWPKQPRT